MNIFSNESALDGARTTERTYRKVELQSPADLTYLIAKVSRAAREKIDKHFPPDAALQGGDRMRSRIEMLVDDYIRSTFNLAKPNLSVNGMDAKEMEAELAKAEEGEEFEPFDAKLVQRVQSLSAQIEASTLDLANLRRNAPAQTAKHFHEVYSRQDGESKARLRVAQEQQASKAEQSSLKIGEIERLDDIRQTWQTSSNQLKTLGKDLASVAEKAEQAHTAVEYVNKS